MAFLKLANSSRHRNMILRFWFKEMPRERTLPPSGDCRVRSVMTKINLSQIQGASLTGLAPFVSGR